MNPLVPFVQLAGGVHLAIVAANVLLPRRLSVREYLPRLSPILRQVFLVHWLYILGVLLIFGALCVFFADDLAGASPLGRAISACLAVFWLVRVAAQLFYYDAEFKRRNRAGDVAITLAFAYLGAVFGLAALGVVR